MKMKTILKLQIIAILLALSANVWGQQSVQVSGSVVDNAGIPIPGVNVVEKGTTNGTITNIDGQFAMNVSEDPMATLIFSFIGYVNQEIVVGQKTSFSIVLEEESIGLNEIVAIGYGTVKKRDLTGSVGSLDTKMLTERGTTNALEAMQGAVAGVQISSSTGRIGDGFEMVIRGKNTMNSSAKPLYVIDGVQADNIDFLNPQDIARIDILKDASSTAIYGSRATNGVVIVTTKQGSDVKQGVTVSYDGYYGIRKAARLPDLMSGSKWWDYHQSAYLATAKDTDGNGSISESELFSSVVGASNSELLRRANENDFTDWYDEVLQNGRQQNHYVSLSGKSKEGISYVLGVGYQEETGNIPNESLEKYSFKGSVNHKISDKFKAGANFTMALSEQESGSDVAMQEAFRLSPLLSPVDSLGNLVNQPGKYKDANDQYLINKTSTWNPILEMENSSDNTRRWNGIGNVFVQYDAKKWLSFKSTFMVGFDNSRRGRSWGLRTNTGSKQGITGKRDTKEDFNYTWDNQMNISKDYEDHSFNFLALQSVFSRRIETSFMNSNSLPFESGFYNVGTGSNFNIGSDYRKNTMLSYVLRLNYSYKQRYLVTLSNRWDGSSVLSDGNKWDAFPSVALGWRISEEGFLEDFQNLSNLKLRLSYGTTGNSSGVSPYATVSNPDVMSYYDFGGTVANGFLPGAIANNSLMWERNKEYNLGLDYGFLNNRISGTIDFYDRKSEDLLMLQKLPKESGWENMWGNVGSVRNKGVELSLTTINVESKNIHWQTTFTFAKNENSIESLYGQSEVDDIGNEWFIGKSIDSEYNYKFDGIWQADEAAEAASYGQTEGQAKVVDINNDGVIKAADDKVILGSNDPDWTGGFNTSLNIYNFDLGLSLFASHGSYVYSNFHANFTNTRDRGRAKLDIDSWYVPENNARLTPQASNEYPQPRNMGVYWKNDNVGYYREVNFVKIKNISMGYTFKPELIEKVGMKSCRVYVNIINPFVFTDYDGYDPEWAGASLSKGGVSSVTYQFGASVKF
ncbi:MAG: TonB-dependent receptor [Labilibaculum sp.]|nr:TonB-dependent receptor [Labilibaculum sp.]MBI9057488.1 TonB-dependent receptor [Labilibaculum sp.]